MTADHGRGGRGLNPLSQLAAAVATGTGLRLSEIAALRREDIDLDARRLRITPTKQGATAGTGARTITISDALAAELAAAVPSGSSGYIFSRRATSPSPHGVRHLLRRAAAQARLSQADDRSGESVHTLRLHYIRRMIAAWRRGK